MSEAAFPAHIAAALDRLTVPALPSGFAERLLARIAAGALPAEAIGDLPPLPAPRRAITGARRWLRPGRIVVGVMLVGITTATAAASGVFGEPVYVPVVSEALAKVDLVAIPKQKPVRKVAPPVAQTAVKEQAAVTGTEAVHQLYDRLRADKQFRALPPRERAVVARKELDAMLRAGTIKPGEIRQALYEMREERLEKARLSGTGAIEAKPKPKRNIPPEVIAERRAAIQALPQEDKRRLLELRRALRVAPPAERPAIRREIREILRKAEENAPQAEGNAEPTR